METVFISVIGVTKEPTPLPDSSLSSSSQEIIEQFRAKGVIGVTENFCLGLRWKEHVFEVVGYRVELEPTPLEFYSGQHRIVTSHMFVRRVQGFSQMWSHIPIRSILITPDLIKADISLMLENKLYSIRYVFNEKAYHNAAFWKLVGLRQDESHEVIIEPSLYVQSVLYIRSKVDSTVALIASVQAQMRSLSKQESLLLTQLSELNVQLHEAERC